MRWFLALQVPCRHPSRLLFLSQWPDPPIGWFEELLRPPLGVFHLHPRPSPGEAPAAPVGRHASLMRWPPALFLQLEQLVQRLDFRLTIPC